MLKAVGDLLKRNGLLPLLFFFLSVLPIVLISCYGSFRVGAYISDPMWKDFLFKMMGLASVGFLMPVRTLRYFWWAILLSHFLTKDALFQGNASFYLLNVSLGIILFSFIYKDPTGNLYQWFCRGIFLSVIANLLLQVLQIFQADPFHTFWKLSPAGGEIMRQDQVPCGFLGNPVTLGVYYSIVMPFLLVSCGKYFPALAIPLLIGVIFTHSKIAFFVAVILFILCAQQYTQEHGTRWKRALELGFFSFLAMIPFSLQQASTIETAFRYRWVIWSGAIQHLTDPLLGDGFSSWFLRQFWYQGSIWPQACNEYVQIFYELGIVGIGFLFFYSFQLLKRVRSFTLSNSSRPAFYSILAVAITSLFFFPLHLPQTAVPFIVSLAYLERSFSHVGVS